MSQEAQELKEANQKIQEKNRRLEAVREQVARRDREIENLRSLLSGSQVRAHTFFLTGRAKSGTSWLMRLLNTHPEVLCRGEGRIVGQKYRRPDVRRMDSKTLQPSSLYRAILDAEYLNIWVERSVWTRDGDKEELLDGITRVTAQYFMERLMVEDGKKIVGDKTPFLNVETMSEISRIFPDSKVIHIIRDGRDVAVSAMHHLWNYPVDLGGRQDLRAGEQITRDLYREDSEKFLKSGKGLFTEERMRNLARGWKSQVSRGRSDGANLLKDRYIEVRYEDLLQDPVGEAKRLFEFLGADSSGGTVKKCVEESSFEQWSGGRKPGVEDSGVLLRKGITGDWKNVFTKRDRQIFNATAGDVLVKLGYEADRNW